MQDKPKADQTKASAYVAALQRLEGVLADAEAKSWQTLQGEVEKAVHFEQEAERLTAEEASLLKAYVKRDLASLLHFIRETGQGVKEWLRFDLDVLETGLKRSLLAIADKTQVGQQQLEHQLHHQEGAYVAGEVALPGMLRCTECGKMVCLVDVARVDPCHRCEGLYFRRITGRDT